jgi:hypothetical protein
MKRGPTGTCFHSAHPIAIERHDEPLRLRRRMPAAPSSMARGVGCGNPDDAPARLDARTGGGHTPAAPQKKTRRESHLKFDKGNTMGLSAGKDYSAKDIQTAVRSVTDNATLTVTIKDLGKGNATLVVGGKQLASSFSSSGSKIKWAKDMQNLIKDATGGGTLNWSGS